MIDATEVIIRYTGQREKLLNKRKNNDKVSKLKQTHKSLSHDTSQAITDPAEDTDIPGTEDRGRTPATVVVVDRLATEVDRWLQ